MKRFHVHVGVGDIDDGIAFYSKLFGAQPTVRKPDYAKWMLEDPRLNFAISMRGGRPGVNHLGFQLDSDEELQAMRAQLAATDAGLVEEIGVSCCYAKSDKYWVTDPAGIAWETCRTLGSVAVFGSEAQDASGARVAQAPDACCTTATACCATEAPAVAACCAPRRAGSGAGTCCA